MMAYFYEVAMIIFTNNYVIILLLHFMQILKYFIHTKIEKVHYFYEKVHYFYEKVHYFLEKVHFFYEKVHSYKDFISQQYTTPFITNVYVCHL